MSSPLMLSSPIPADYVDHLRTPFNLDDYEECADGSYYPSFHRLNSISNGSEISSRMSVRDSDSEQGDNVNVDSNPQKSAIVGSRYIAENPQCTFDEVMKRMRAEREGKENAKFEKCVNRTEVVEEKQLPGSKNQSVTLMI